MDIINKNYFKKKMLRLYGLTISCTFETECPNCHIKYIRKINDFEKQVEFIDSLPKEEVFSLLAFHDKRVIEREHDIYECKAN